jgi:hypothetical protein
MFAFSRQEAELDSPHTAGGQGSKWIMRVLEQLNNKSTVVLVLDLLR